ncbi:MAG TPA: NUDIX hydrolase, partial [Candidatus Saccharimonadales bacterium]|nr:NUDIX hydrolase [Candidatus Saccharimonadales bacterium]
MVGRYRTIRSKVVHVNPWFKVRKDNVVKPNGQPGEYFVVQPSQNVTIVAVNNKQETYLIRLFRYPTQTDSIEVPSGGTDGEDSLVAAKRELQEEAGLLAKRWTRVGHLQLGNGLSDQWSDIYLAQELEETAEHEQAEEGIEEVLTVPLTQVLDMIQDGRITDMPTI